jgi:Carboxypeptidase regulatory-like domain
MVNGRRLRAIFNAAVCTLCVSFPVLAQQNVGGITGVVTDPSGAVLPTVVVTATAVDTGVTLKVAVNEGGAYAFSSLLTGEYKLAAEATGCKTVERPGVRIAASAALAIDFHLELGQSSESVQVVGEAPKVDTTTVTEGNTMFISQINELPLTMQGGARNATSFIGILPGVIGGPGTGVSTSTINRGREGTVRQPALAATCAAGVLTRN